MVYKSQKHRKQIIEGLNKSLGINTINVALSDNFDLSQYKQLRALRYSIRNEVVKRKLVSKRTCMCGTVLQNCTEVRLEKNLNQSSKLLNIMHCGSIWQCDVCSSKILQGRQAELEIINQKHTGSGGGVQLVTFTARHRIKDQLPDLLGDSESKTGISGAFRRLRQDKAWRKIKEKFGIQFDCRALETTYGSRNGWHVHIHSLFYTEKPLTDGRMKELNNDLYSLWKRVSLKSGLKSPDRQHGTDVRDGSNAGRYVAKWGSPNELTSPVKLAKNGNLTMWELKNSLVNPADSKLPISKVESLLKVYYDSFFGKKLLTWSDPDGFKKKYLTEEKTDEEILRENNVDSLIIAGIGRLAYNRLKILNRIADARSIYEVQGFDALYSFMKSLNIDTSQVNFLEDKSLTDKDFLTKSDYFLREFGFFPDCKDPEFLKYSVLNYHRLVDIVMTGETDFSYQKYGRFKNWILEFYTQFNQNILNNC